MSDVSIQTMGATLQTQRNSGAVALPIGVLRVVRKMSPIQEALYVREQLRQRSISLTARAHDMGAFHQMAVRLKMEPRPGSDSKLGPMGRAYAKRLAIANTVRAALEAYVLAGSGRGHLIARSGPDGRTAVRINLAELTPYVAESLEQMFLSKEKAGDVVGFWPWAARGAAALAASPVARRVAGKVIVWTAAGLGIGYGADKVNALLTSEEKLASEAVTMEAIRQGKLPELMRLRMAEAELAAKADAGFFGKLGSSIGSGLLLAAAAFVAYKVATRTKGTGEMLTNG